jgi:hypothetical protein
MRTITLLALAVTICAPPLAAQEVKPVPKDSVRVVLPGCTKGYVFTVGERSTEQPGNLEIAEGTHLRMNGPRKMMGQIKAHEGSMIEITGLMKKGQTLSEGVRIGGNIRLGPAPAPGGAVEVPTLPAIDVEGWRPAEGSCPER